ncbi:SRPBCC domain-containing protein [uncultured Chryseobacterium sp.]|uniref:SRPBCC family protein n=1 Tax=uncultured Chryseobacterium sp. TaxID=259322 RepID=UPI00262ECF79|nr:SRPBCC domain-containing protein [uncultured Chryseobacterium sp.]
MELKTQIHAADNRQEILITREFDLPVELLFKAYTDPEIVEQWMDNKVLEMDNKQHGSYQFEKKDAQGNILFSAHGAIHEFLPNQRIIRTFQMENTPFPAQLEFLEFEKITEDTSKITIQMIYKSVDYRDQMLKLPFKQGINMAHQRLQEIVSRLK